METHFDAPKSTFMLLLKVWCSVTGDFQEWAQTETRNALVTNRLEPSGYHTYR